MTTATLALVITAYRFGATPATIMPGLAGEGAAQASAACAALGSFGAPA